jgi:pimeloyl-ACP methyl ester carboxylesterase
MEFEYADELFVDHVTHENAYLNFGSLTTYGPRLVQAIGIVKTCNPGVDVNIIANSMGGLAARYAAQDGAVNKIVTLDTGHFGFNTAASLEWVSTFLPASTQQDICFVHQNNREVTSLTR